MRRMVHAREVGALFYTASVLVMCALPSFADAEQSSYQDAYLTALKPAWRAQFSYWLEQTSRCFIRLESKASTALEVEATLREACEDGEDGGCTQLGILYEEGITGQPRPARAKELYQQACTWQEWDGCYRLAQVEDTAPALALLRRACMMDHIPSCEHFMLLRRGDTRDPEATSPGDIAGALERSCQDAGDAKACTHLGLLYHRKSTLKDAKQRALAHYKRGCIGKDPVACHALAHLYNNGEGTARDTAKAIALFATACEDDLPESCRNAGVYEHERGNTAHAIPHFEHACALGEPDSCSYLGVLLSLGAGVKRDLDRARKLQESACEQGVARGCFELGMMYWQGAPVARSVDRAAALFSLACKHGEPVSCKNMGNLALQGLGVPADDVAAARYYAKGCRLGDGQACYNQAQLSINAGVDTEHIDELYEMACARGYERACPASE